jgi:hypothetical protein
MKPVIRSSPPIRGAAEQKEAAYVGAYDVVDASDFAIIAISASRATETYPSHSRALVEMNELERGPELFGLQSRQSPQRIAADSIHRCGRWRRNLFPDLCTEHLVAAGSRVAGGALAQHAVGAGDGLVPKEAWTGQRIGLDCL